MAVEPNNDQVFARGTSFECDGTLARFLIQRRGPDSHRVAGGEIGCFESPPQLEGESSGLPNLLRHARRLPGVDSTDVRAWLTGRAGVKPSSAFFFARSLKASNQNLPSDNPDRLKSLIAEFDLASRQASRAIARVRRRLCEVYAFRRAHGDTNHEAQTCAKKLVGSPKISEASA